MIYWSEYKILKAQAEKLLEVENPENLSVKVQVLTYRLKRISKEQCVENIINILSEGEHFRPLEKLQ